MSSPSIILFLTIAIQLISNGFGVTDTDPLVGSTIYSMENADYDIRVKTVCAIPPGTSTTFTLYPAGNSIETLISLVEKLENPQTNQFSAPQTFRNDAETITRLLLRRFHYDDYHVYTGEQNNNAKQLAIMDGIFKQKADTEAFPESYLQEYEKCALFHMMSHNYFNYTSGKISNSRANAAIRVKRQWHNQGSGRSVASQYLNNQNRQNQPNPSNPGGTIDMGRDLPLDFVQEDGVVGFRGQNDEAIAVSRVLLGVLVGLMGLPDKSIKQILTDAGKPDMADRVGKDNLEANVDPLYMVTLADLYGSASSDPSTPGVTSPYIYGVNGLWRVQSCASQYAIKFDNSNNNNNDFEKTKSIKASLAEIRGGLDGLLIGRALKSNTAISSRKSELRLSTILRQYYSPRGITSGIGGTSVGYCRRNTGIDMNELKKQAEGYNIIWQYYGKGTKKPLYDSEFSNALQMASKPSTGQSSLWCNVQSGSMQKGDACETPSDVFFIIDSSLGHLNSSKNVVNNIASNLVDLRRYGGTVSVFVGGGGGGGGGQRPDLPTVPYQLAAVSFNGTSSSCASCAISDLDTSPMQPSKNIRVIYELLNGTLRDYEWWSRANYSAVPGKSVVLMDFGFYDAIPTQGDELNKYNDIKERLKWQHRDVLYLSVAEKAELFKDILRDPQKDHTPALSFNDNLGNQLAQRICENPAIFQHNQCQNHASNDEESLYVGFVTPGYRQNWAMFPEYFLKSFNIRFNFKAETGSIKVCFGRNSLPDQDCREIKSGGTDYFDMNNPCDGKSFQSCQPFYFTIWGKPDTAGNTPCLDPRCKSWDQIKYTVSHHGVQCNSALQFFGSSHLYMTSLMIALIFYFFK